MKNVALKYSLSILFTILFAILSVKAWDGLTASNGDKLDYQKWNELVATVQSGIPTGAVMAFNLSSCPTGWSAYTQAAGRTIIGTGNGAGSNETLGATGGDKSTPAISGTVSLPVTATARIATSNTSPGSITPSDYAVLRKAQQGLGGVTLYLPAGTTADLNIGPAGSVTGTASGPISLGGTATDNMQPYVALLYCQKN